MDLSIVIVTYNSRTPVESCLNSLERYTSSRPSETIVVDNASSDGTVGFIRDRFPKVRILANDENFGYSRAVNQGIRLSTGKFILILNPDIIVQESSLDRLLDFMDSHPDAGIAGAKLTNPDGSLQYSARAFYTLGALLFRRTFLGKLFPRAKPIRDHLLIEYDHEEEKAVDWIIGACMMVRREALEKVGGMDERFFLYFEDLDWCFRMKRHGWKVYYVPSAVMIHTYERSSARSVFKKPFLFHFLSMMRYYEKWNSVFYWFRRNRAAIKVMVLSLGDLVSFNLAFIAAYFARDLLQPLFVNELYPVGWYRFFVLFYNLIFLLTFAAFGLYRVKRETPVPEEVVRVARAAVLGTVILMAATYISRIRIYSRAIVVIQGLIVIILCTLIRQLARAVHRELVKARFDLKHVLIVGTKEEAELVRRRFASEPEMGIEVVGFMDMTGNGLGKPEELPEIVERFTIQEVIVCQSHSTERSITAVLGEIRRRMIDVKMISPLARILGSGARVEELAGLPAFTMERRSFIAFERVLKRVTDFAVGLVVLPFSALGALFLRAMRGKRGGLRSWKEIRRGRGGAEFLWPRATNSSGKELSDLAKPGLWLLLAKGRLSLVGPPALKDAPSDYVEMLSRGRPGITGRWRVARHESRMEALESEVAAVDSQSTGRDLSILISSVRAICSGSYPAWFHGEENLS